MTTKDVSKDSFRRGQNFRILREFYCETQIELREFFIKTGLLKQTSSKKTGGISKYENGLTEPNIDMLKAYSEHYGVDYKTIIDDDLKPLDDYRINNKANLLKFYFYNMFPIIEETLLKKNKNFLRAWYINKDIFFKLDMGLYKKYSEFEKNCDECLEYYTKAYEDGIREARINTLSILILIALYYLSNSVEDNNFDTISSFILNFHPENNQNYIENKKEFSKAINDVISLIKGEINENEVLQFYEAIICIFDIYDINMKMRESIKFGIKRMEILAEKGNTYSIKCLEWYYNNLELLIVEK